MEKRLRNRREARLPKRLMHDVGCETKQMDFESLVERFLCPEVRAIALAASFARGDWGVFSDIDLVRFLRADA